MNKTIAHQESTNEIKRRTTNLRDALVVAAILFIALMVGSAPQADSGRISGRDVAWVAITYVGVLAFLVAAYLSYRRADERQQLVQLKAAAATFLAVLLGLFTTEMAYSLWRVNLKIMIQILFIGSIAVWVMLQKIIGSQDL